MWLDGLRPVRDGRLRSIRDMWMQVEPVWLRSGRLRLGGGDGGGRAGDLARKAYGFAPTSIVGKCLDRRFGEPCGKYRSFFSAVST